MTAIDLEPPRRARLRRRHALSRGSSGGVLRAATRRAAHCPKATPTRPGGSGTILRSRGTPLALVAAGVLAANPHDTQPWLFGVQRERDRDLRRSLAQSRRDGRLLCARCISVSAARSRTWCSPPVPTATTRSSRSCRGRWRRSTERADAGSRRDAASDASARARRRIRSTAPSPIVTPTVTPTIATGRCREDWRDFAAHAGVGDDVGVFLFDDGEPRASLRRRRRRGDRGDHRRQGHDRRQRPLVPRLERARSTPIATGRRWTRQACLPSR